jgi:hypothetical protein
MSSNQKSPSDATAPTPAITDMIAQVETVSSEPQAFELTTPMSIPAGIKILVTCRGGIKLEMSPGQHVTLSAKTPTKLFSPIAMRIESAEQLGPDFARGWRKLPEELRLKVQAHNLVSADPIRKAPDGFTMRQTLYDYRAMVPDIAPQAHDTFYRENSFQFSPWRSRPLMLPPVPLRLLIKRMTLLVDLDKRHWDMLENFSKTSWGFSNLNDITIKFCINLGMLKVLGPTYSVMGDILGRPLYFPRNGQAMIQDDDLSVAQELTRHGTDFKTVREQLSGLLHFGL